MARTPATDEIIRKLREIKPILAEKYGVTRIRVFGSVARGEAREDSDIDLILDFKKPIGWDYFIIDKEIAGMVGRDVDVVTESSIKPYIKEVILSESRDI